MSFTSSGQAVNRYLLYLFGILLAIAVVWSNLFTGEVSEQNPQIGINDEIEDLTNLVPVKKPPVNHRQFKIDVRKSALFHGLDSFQLSEFFIQYFKKLNLSIDQLIHADQIIESFDQELKEFRTRRSEIFETANTENELYTRLAQHEQNVNSAIKQIRKTIRSKVLTREQRKKLVELGQVRQKR